MNKLNLIRIVKDTLKVLKHQSQKYYRDCSEFQTIEI